MDTADQADTEEPLKAGSVLKLAAKSMVVLRAHSGPEVEVDYSAAASLACHGRARGRPVEEMAGAAQEPRPPASRSRVEGRRQMRTPVSTYRLQIRPGFTLQDAAETVPYLKSLGVDWIYLSPILTAEKGSDHGYDVTDPSAIDPDRGGPEGLAAASQAARDAGMGVLVDIVPNHVGVATPAQNPWWWSLLKEGQQSRYAPAFDVDWDFGGGRIRIPVLGSDSDVDALEIKDGELRYYDHRFPLAEGSYTEGDDPREVHDRQHYELIGWRRADNELNYRRFFAVNSLAGIRVELPEVFDEAHAEIVRWFRDGLVDGLRIDHPDGLADPEGYLRRLREVTGGSYLLIEKILEPGEVLPAELRLRGHHRLRRPRGRGPALRRPRRAGRARRPRHRAARRPGGGLRGDDPGHQAPDHRRDPPLRDAPAGAAGAVRHRAHASRRPPMPCPRSSPPSRCTAATCPRARTS